MFPVTLSVSKQLLPVYDKPMIYYPLSVLMLAGIRDILIITTPNDSDAFQRLLGCGEKWGIRLTYAQQPKPEGLAQAFIIGKDFIGADSVALILGDNIFWGHGFVESLVAASRKTRGASVFAYWVNDPQRYGVVEIDKNNKPLRIVEKPADPRSNYAVTGLYFYDNRVADFAARLSPSVRGELEITDLNQQYLDIGDLDVVKLGRGVAWLDTGTHESMLQACVFVETIQARQGLKVACPEEISFRNGYIDKNQLLRLAEPLKKSGYGEYLIRLYNEQ